MVHSATKGSQSGFQRAALANDVTARLVDPVSFVE
jgi:hypothetical protein